MKPSPENPVCIECGLFHGCKSPFMSSVGAKKPRILIIGEAPGEDEDKIGIPFVGRAGQLLKNVLEEVGVDETEVRFTNTVRCRPPDNKITKEAIQACRSFAMVEVKHFHPELVFLLGNTPLSGILGESGITNWNGSIVGKDIDGEIVKFVPLFHPAYILYDNMHHLDEWLGAMLNALEGADDTSGKRPDIEVILPKTSIELSDMLSYLLSYDEIVFDFETTSLDAFSKQSQIVAVAFAAGDKAYAYPINHKDANGWWTESPYDLKDYAIKLTIKILNEKHGHLIGHNVKFDKIWADNIFKMDVDASGDTMLISHLLDSRAGIHGLKRLAGVYCNMYDYDNPLREYIATHADANTKRGGNYGNIPLPILLPYAALDAKATLILNEQLLSKLSGKQKILYDELIIPASNMLSRMQANGLVTDSFIAHRYFHIYTYLQKLEYEKLCDDKYVCKITKGRNKALGTNGKKTKTFVFNPNSPLQLRELYFKCYKIPVLARSKKTDQPSTSGKVYVSLENTYPILNTVRMFKMYNKALSTYLGPAMNGTWLSDDGLVHSTFNQHTVVTGRLSSSDPVNLQNMPAPEKEPGTVLEYLPIKNIFTHRDWWAWSGNDVDPAEIYNDIYDTGALVMFDQSGMELRVFASLAKCDPMLAIHKSGLDFHSMVAIMSLEHTYPDKIEPDYVKWFKKNKAEVRYRYKWTNWTLLYGGDAYTLHRLYDVPIIDAEETVKMYYELFPEVLEYRKWTQEFAEDNGYIESIFGRREYLPYINSYGDQGRQNQARRAAVNMPVQSTASDTVLASMVMIEKELRKQGFASKLVNTVHDSGVGDCPRSEIVTFARLAKDVMENVPTYAVKYMPNVDFSWLLCPLIADVDVGTHYGVHISLNEFIETYESVGIVK